MTELRIDYARYDALVKDVIRQVSNSGFRPDYIVGINSGIQAAIRIASYLDVKWHYLDARTWLENGTESNFWMAEDAFAGKKILIVSDINSYGDEFQYIVDDWSSFGGVETEEQWESILHKTVKFAILVDNVNDEFESEYVGMEYQENLTEKVTFQHTEFWRF